MGKSHIKSLKESQARTGRDMADAIDKWRELCYRQSDTIKHLTARIDELENTIKELRNN